ncbi:MAG: DNA recombination protein RmuC [Ilumatobacteraceae bacterium]|nr:DNA recombination protein RmuC [Ilumatobacteraceae bacterium]
MEALAVVAVVIALAAVALVVMNSRRATPPPMVPAVPAPVVDTAALRAEMSAELARTVGETVNASLATALHQLSEQSRRDREESIKIAAESIAKSGGEQLGSRAELIDNTLRNLTGEMNQRIDALSKELQVLQQVNTSQYDNVGKAVEALARRTDNLSEILSSSQKRGQWGERVVEDMLRAVGFIEGVNYSKQDVNTVGGRPDYKFHMPPDRVLFMDVKFPLDRYADHFNADNDALRQQAKTEFVKAVKGHVDALARRDYTLNAKEEALDYVLMFLPNESISGFVHEADPGMIDYALGKKVVLCSPLALYSFLSVIRQATDSFHTEQTAASIMQQINKFNKEWQNYVKAVDEVKDVFHRLTDKVDSIGTDGTRFKKLNVPIKAIEKMRTKQGILELPGGDDSDGFAFDDE